MSHNNASRRRRCNRASGRTIPSSGSGKALPLCAQRLDIYSSVARLADRRDVPVEVRLSKRSIFITAPVLEKRLALSDLERVRFADHAARDGPEVGGHDRPFERPRAPFARPRLELLGDVPERDADPAELAKSHEPPEHLVVDGYLLAGVALREFVVTPTVELKRED